MAGEQQGEEEEALAGAPAGARGARAEEGEVTWHLYIILFVIVLHTLAGMCSVTGCISPTSSWNTSSSSSHTRLVGGKILQKMYICNNVTHVSIGRG